MDKQTIKNALVFLSRVNLTGNEVVEYVKVINALKDLETKEEKKK